MKLLSRYSVINLLILTFIFIISSFVLYYFTQVILIREMDADLRGMKSNVKSYVDKFGSLPNQFPLDDQQISIVATGLNRPAENSELVQRFSSRENKMHNFRKLDFPLWFKGSWYRITLAKPIEGMHHLSRALIIISLITILIIIIISLLLSRILLRRLWQPFYTSINIMRQYKIGKGQLLSFPKTTVEEFAFMNESLLLATQKAEQDYVTLKDFTENASHEMQTPLSIIRSKLDILIQEKDFSEKQSESLKAAYSSIKKLSRLNQSLLLLAKIDNKQFCNTMVIDLKQKVEDKIFQFQELWQSRQIVTTYDLQESRLSADPDLLDILLNNLLSNACNHNSPDGMISITLKQKQLEIFNTGEKGSLDEKRLFMRFYKQSVNSNSNGLGLSIIKQISLVSGISASYRFCNNLHYFTLNW